MTVSYNDRVSVFPTRSSALFISGITSVGLHQRVTKSDPSSCGPSARGVRSAVGDGLPRDRHPETDAVQRHGHKRSTRKGPAGDHPNEGEAGGEAGGSRAGQTQPSAGTTPASAQTLSALSRVGIVPTTADICAGTGICEGGKERPSPRGHRSQAQPAKGDRTSPGGLGEEDEGHGGDLRAPEG